MPVLLALDPLWEPFTHTRALCETLHMSEEAGSGRSHREEFGAGGEEDG